MEYNRHMGGVDRVDQQLHSLKVLRKSCKWYKKIVFRSISQVILNSHKMYQKVTGKTDVTFLKFLHDVIIQLITQSNTLIDPSVPIDDTYIRLTGRHFPSVKKALPQACDQRPTKLCRVCNARNKKTVKGKPIKTIYVCSECPSERGLHPDTCFEMYHTMLDYSETI